MNTLAKSPVEAAQEDMRYTQREVRDITGISIDEQHLLMEEAAWQFLASMGCDYDMRHQFASTREFWGFWKIQWNEIDKQFVNHFIDWDYDLSHAAGWYHSFHNVHGNPTQGARMNAAYHQLIKTLAVKR